MAAVIEAVDGQHAYPKVIEHVLKNGVLRAPRGQTTLDAGFTVIELQRAYNALPLGCGRELNRNIAAAEAVQLVGGFAQPDLLLRAAPQFSRYMDGHTFHGAYGERIDRQMLHIKRKLERDPNTRQAIVTLWDPWRDNMPDKRDYPCTVSLLFEMREGYLCMTTLMRSNDVWLGLPYDMFQFTQLQLSLAISLGVNAGYYRHVAHSMHIYSEHVISAETKIHDPVDFSVQPSGFGRTGMSFYDIMLRAQMTTRSDIVNEDETASEAWYRERFASYMGQDVDERGDGGGGAIAL